MRYCAVIFFVSCLVMIGCSMAGRDEDWPMYMHDAQHSGFSPTKIQTPLKELWRHENYGTHEPPIAFDPDYEGAYTRLVISGEKIFVLLHPSIIFSLDANNGSLLWSEQADPMDTIRWSFPAVTNQRTYASMTNRILCIDSSTGNILWDHEALSLAFESSPIIIDNHVIVGGGEPAGSPHGIDEEAKETQEHAYNYARRVLCLHAETGETVWEFYADDFTGYSPAYFDTRIYVNDGDKNVYCLNSGTGELIWKKPVKWTSTSSLSLDGERIFTGTFDGIVCLDIETGETLWTFSSDDSIFETPALAYGRVYVGALDGVFYCLDSDHGDLIWKIETESRIISPAVTADGKVFFGTDNGELYVANAQSGEIIDFHDLGRSGIGAIALSKGKLIAGQENGRIICFEGSSNWIVPIIYVVFTIAFLSSILAVDRTRKSLIQNFHLMSQYFHKKIIRKRAPLIR